MLEGAPDAISASAYGLGSDRVRETLSQLPVNASVGSGPVLRGLGPDEGLGAVVVVLDEVVDRGDELGDVVVDAAADLLVGEDREPDLDHVHPRCAGGSEVEVHALVALQPACDLWGAVGGGVVERDVQWTARVGT